MMTPEENIIAIVPYGSHVYGTQTEDSDYDFFVIIKDGCKLDDGHPLLSGLNTDYNIWNETTFQLNLKYHEISFLEVFFTEPVAGSLDQFSFELDLIALRHSVSEKSSNSWVKCKKKLTVEEGQELIGLKSMFHAFRMVDFAIQIAQHGQIFDFKHANHYWKQIKTIGADWQKLNHIMKPQYNQLMTEFRKHAPKEYQNGSRDRSNHHNQSSYRL